MSWHQSLLRVALTSQDLCFGARISPRSVSPAVLHLAPLRQITLTIQHPLTRCR